MPIRIGIGPWSGTAELDDMVWSSDCERVKIVQKDARRDGWYFCLKSDGTHVSLNDDRMSKLHPFTKEPV